MSRVRFNRMERGMFPLPASLTAAGAIYVGVDYDTARFWLLAALFYLIWRYCVYRW